MITSKEGENSFFQTGNTSRGSSKTIPSTAVESSGPQATRKWRAFGRTTFWFNSFNDIIHIFNNQS